MNNTRESKTTIDVLAETLDIPDSAYEAATNRYKNLGKWLHESKAEVSKYDPEVFPQGSFRLGTAIKPLEREDYDLDLACKLRDGLSKTNCTQEQLKILVGKDLEAYRIERGIEAGLDEKHRCWRINYQDHIKFHMDTVPSIPQTKQTIQKLEERMINEGADQQMAKNVSELAIAITDDRHPNYKHVANDWQISNPEGYGKWFESKMRKAAQLLESRAITESVASVDELPTYKWKTPLQHCIQILKRHRDIMFKGKPDMKPISIIITTLAAKAYQGESNLQSAMENILNKMGGLVNHLEPKVPNPVNPEEDFADNWNTEEGRRLNLEENFWLWLKQAKIDFEIITSPRDNNFILEQANEKYGLQLDPNSLITGTISGVSAESISTPKIHKINKSPKPWGL